ncbi:MAG: TerB family tellurite resistance protein [Bacteroidia bacterium]
MSGSTLGETEPVFSSGTRAGGDFSHSFLVLTAAVLRADGTVTRNELEFVKELYKQNFGIDKTKADMLVLRDILQGEIIQWETACLGIKQNMIQTERVKLIHYLFGIAKADGSITQNELNTIRNISLNISLSQWDFEAIKVRFTHTYSQENYEGYTGGYGRQTSFYKRDDHYKTLGLESSATDEIIKTTYRKLARQYHPDKHASKSPQEVKAAEEKFKKIQEAYNEIKKERGL